METQPTPYTTKTAKTAAMTSIGVHPSGLEGRLRLGYPQEVLGGFKGLHPVQALLFLVRPTRSSSSLSIWSHPFLISGPA